MIPSPTLLHFRSGRAGVDAKAYPDITEYFSDLARVYREEIAALYQAGCRYLQIDETNFPFLCDPKLHGHVRSIGEDPKTIQHTYAKLLNDVTRERPADMRIVMHMCRGNHESAWVASGGYEPVAEIAFGQIDADGFFLEYDSDRAGGFEPLRHLSKNKVAVLGLVTTKKASDREQGRTCAPHRGGRKIRTPRTTCAVATMRLRIHHRRQPAYRRR